MLDNRETLREFSVTLHTDKGDKYVIHYGYDLAMSGSEFYVKASINDSELSSTKKVLDKVRKLKIEAINSLIDLIGCNETGVHANYMILANMHLQMYVQAKHGKKSATEHALSLSYLTGADSEKLNEMLQKVYNLILTNKEKNALSLFERFIDSTRIAKLIKVRSTIQSIRKTHYKGITISGNHSGIRFEGYLKKNHYPVYYKRDIDLIRISRMRVYKNLGKDYKPV